MIKPGGKIFIFILTIAIAGFFCGQKVSASQSILISEVQITGGAGKTENDFIELYNPDNFPVNLKGYRLVKRTKTGATDTSIKSWSADVFIPAHDYYLWANSNYTDISATPNATTTATISDDNGVAIRFGAAETGVIIDSVAWGKAQNVFIEGAVFPTNPGAKQSLERKFNSDTNDNSADFFIQENPNPRSSVNVISPPAQCGNGRVENSEQCDDGNLASGDGCDLACQTETATSTPIITLEQNEAASSTTSLISPWSGGTNSASQAGQKINFGEVVINELVSDPADNEVEWLELYNKADREIDLTGWWLEDGSKAKTKLAGRIGANGSDRYKIIDQPTGILNNGGDLIILYDERGKIIDQAAYGDWDDGNTADNAPAGGDPGSTARKFDGYNTFNNANDFAVTIKPTKGTSNIIQAEDEVSASAKTKFDFTRDIFIAEILPNPTGDDAKLEFIEIYNASGREINLVGWSLSNEDNKKINFEKIATSTIIKVGEYLAVYRPKTKIVLHNDQGQIKLFQPLTDKPLMAVAYKNVKEGWSYNLKNSLTPLDPLLVRGEMVGDWLWSETPTPGAINIFKTANHAPVVEFSLPKEARLGQPVLFDSSDTDDPDGDSLKYAWDFGDGFKNTLANPEHTFFKVDIYQVKLAVSDEKAVAEKVKSVKVVSRVGELGGVDEIDISAEDLFSAPGGNPPNPVRLNVHDEVFYQGGSLVINEIFPNPAGADTGSEWAELKNQSPDKINLLNWRLENGNGKYKFKNNLWLDAENFYLLNNGESKLAFKNTDDVISLYNSLDELIDRLEYTEAVQGEAYARGANGKWFWTTKATPGEENIISLANSQSAAVAKPSGAMGQALNYYMETTLEKIRELEIGSLIKVKGTVAVEPGILGAQIFYIVGSAGLIASSTAALPKADLFAAVLTNKEAAAGEPGLIADAKAGAGIQIYNYKKDFPALKVGDYIEVKGELAETQNGFRIKTKDKNDINLVERKPAPSALALSCDAVNEENIGQLITISGEITDKKARTAYLDDGSDEILVYFKPSAGLDTKSLKTGQAFQVTGILSRTQTGLRLLPRYQTDIVKINQAGMVPQVLGETTKAEEWAVAERDKKLELFKYLLIIAGGAIIILAGLFIKIKSQK